MSQQPQKELKNNEIRNLFMIVQNELNNIKKSMKKIMQNY